MVDHLPSLNALRAFEALSRHLSYRDAAEELGVTPAAVKQLVQKLEDALAVRLVQRKGRGIALTHVAMVALPELRGGFKQIVAAVQKMRPPAGRRSLTISVEPSFAAIWLVKRLNSFKYAHPDVDVLIDSSTRIVDLEHEDIDIAIRYGAAPVEGLTQYRLFDDETLAVCSPSLAKGPPPLERLSDLEKVTLIHMDLGDSEWSSFSSIHWFDWSAWLSFVGAGNVEPRSGPIFNDYSLAVQAAIAGQGVVLGSWPVLKEAIKANLLVSPFEARAKTDIGYDLAVNEEAATRPEVKSFIDWILQETEDATT